MFICTETDRLSLLLHKRSLQRYTYYCCYNDNGNDNYNNISLLLKSPPPPCGSPHITVPIKASMHVEQDPCRREAVPHPGRRRVAGCGGGEVRPGLSDGIVHVQVVEDVSCARRTRDASSELTNATCNKHNDKGTPHHQHKRTNPDAPTKPLSLITVIIVTARIDLTAGLFSLCLADR